MELKLRVKVFARDLLFAFLNHKYFSKWGVLLIDIVIVSIAASLSYLAVRGGNPHPETLMAVGMGTYVLATLVCGLISFFTFKTHRGIIRYSTITEILRVFMASLLTLVLMFAFLYFKFDLPVTVNFSFLVVFGIFLFSGMFLFRILVFYSFERLINRFQKHRLIPIYIWGWNEQNATITQFAKLTNSNFRVKGFVSNNPAHPKVDKVTRLPILKFNEIQDLRTLNVRNILFTDHRTLLDSTEYVEPIVLSGIRVYTAEVKDIDSLSALEESTRKRIRPVQIEDLLARQEITIDLDAINEFVKGKTILVTGAAGSIGSEIVRQLGKFEPQRLICLDQAETPLNDLHVEMVKRFSTVECYFSLEDIRNKSSIQKIFEQFKPDIVYHAAAYKHVPMMELFPSQAVFTNVLGTKNLVDLAVDFGVEKFIMVSTDKAVNPTNVMGASKRIAEIYVQSMAVAAQQKQLKTGFITTRFGNVLGSNGSVIPLFKKQIDERMPITVTHPDITRYFMTIPEACRLVLEASHIGVTGHIYVFDMGEPVKILDMANKMIELAGLIPGKDVKIEFSGLRPGEKLYEELLNDSEITVPTSNEKVLIAQVRKYDLAEVESLINNLIEQAKDAPNLTLVKLIKQIVPEYISQNKEYEIIN